MNPPSKVRAGAGNGRLTFETAAQHATREVPVVDPAKRIGDLRRELIGRRYESASHIAVCRNGRFHGVVRIEDALAASEETAVEAVMDGRTPVVAPGIDQEVAALQAVRHGESALCVVDATGGFIGIVPPARVLEVLLAEHEEDLSRLGGFLKAASTARTTTEEPAPRRLQHRLPWLLLGLCGALLAADLVGAFESALQGNILFAFFLPGIVYLADAVGTQTETIIVRGLSLGVPLRRMVTREVLAGVAIGAVLSVIAGLVVLWRWNDADVSLAVGLAVFASCSTATLAAIALPALFEFMGLDPAFGSGPLATVIQDLLSIWIYLTVTLLLMS